MNTEEQIYFDNEMDFATVRHLKIQGTNFEIGKQIGLIAVQRHGERLESHEANPDFAHARRKYFQDNCPYLWERIRGVASVLGVDPQDNRYDISSIALNLDIDVPTPGCSSVYYSPSTTIDNKGYLSKNFDFSTGSLADAMKIPLPVEKKKEQNTMVGEPYIMEWYPTDGGYASIAISIYDLLSGPVDGVNSAGLAVSLFADEETIADLGNNLERNELRTPQIVGLHAPQVVRHLLDSCSTVEEAKESLLTIKQYYPLWPAIFIIADLSGKSFIYEDSPYRNKQHITDGNGKLQIITNFQVNKHKSRDQMPQEFSMATNAFWRYQKLDELTSEHEGLFTTDNMKYNQQCVNISKMFETLAEDPNHTGVAAGSNARTIWHSLYNQNDKSMEVSFYLGEETNSDGKTIERRSDYLNFSLD